MRGKMIQLAVLVGVVAVALGRLPPPLSTLPKTFDLKEELLQDPSLPTFNIGLEGAVTQEDWDRATVTDSAPNITINDFMGCDRDITLIGQTMMSFKSNEIYAFKGIRFGKAPVGELRFKKTEPAGPYFGNETDTLIATDMGPKCPQMSMLWKVPSGEEDCLFLNVYTPKLPKEGQKKLPVMMWIYGGAFISGDASLYMPTRLLDKDIILVVIQYRIGSLGWFSLQNEDAPGNAGLWDQIEALKWIQDNIDGFGGDPSQVTIAGESAGSASVNYLLLLKNETEGLFHGVIAESGSALDHWSLDPDPITSARVIAQLNGCEETEDLDILYECMKTVPADTLTKVIANFVTDDRKAGQMGFRGAAPVIQVEGLEGSLVIKHPKKYYEEKDMNNVPLLIGANKHEGAFVFGIMYFEYLLPNGLLNDTEFLRDGMMATLMQTFGINDPSNGIGEALKDDYLGGRDIADFENATPGLVDLAGMLFLKAGAWETAKTHAKYTDSNTFVYSFEFESDDTMFKIFFPKYKEAPFKTTGVCHADEMMYIFSLPAVLEGNQVMVKERMVTLWTNFVMHGDPTPAAYNKTWLDLNIPKWEPVNVNDHHFMLIEGECTLMQEYPDRWHITLEDDIAEHSTMSPSTTEDIHGPSQDDYDHMSHQKTVFMGCMIAFIVTTVILAGLSGLFFFKRR